LDQGRRFRPDLLLKTRIAQHVRTDLAGQMPLLRDIRRET
jgi:hypothetical protein